MKNLKRLSRRDFLKLGIAVSLALVLVACSPAPTPTPTPTAAPTATHTPLPTATLLPTATPTAAPTATRTPTPKPTIPLAGLQGVPYPEESLIRAGLEKLGLTSQGLGAGNLIYEHRPNLNDPNKTPIVFGRDPKTNEIVLATRMDQKTKELKWNVAGLRDLADAVGIRIGTNLSSPFYSQSIIALHDTIVLNEFNHATLDQFFMAVMSPEPGSFNFAPAEKAIDLAKANGMTTGVNQLLFGQSDFDGGTFLKKYWQLAEQSGFKTAINNLSFDEVVNMMNVDPIYGQKKLESLIDGLPDPEMRKEIRQARKELRDYIVNYVKTVVSEFRGEVDYWGLINEFDVNPQSTWDRYFWLVGPDYPDLVFQAAREADPTALMLINQQVSLDNNETDWSYMITAPVVRRLDGLINAMGEHGHEDASQPYDWEKRLALLKKYGLPIIITERDVTLKDIPGSDKERLELQAKIYADSIRLALDNGVKFYIFWECFGDKYSWLERLNIPPLSSPKADPTLFFDDGTPKPAYFAVRKVLSERLAQK